MGGSSRLICILEITTQHHRINHSTFIPYMWVVNYWTNSETYADVTKLNVHRFYQACGNFRGLDIQQMCVSMLDSEKQLMIWCVSKVTLRDSAKLISQTRVLEVRKAVHAPWRKGGNVALGGIIWLWLHISGKMKIWMLVKVFTNLHPCLGRRWMSS